MTLDDPQATVRPLGPGAGAAPHRGRTLLFASLGVVVVVLAVAGVAAAALLHSNATVAGDATALARVHTPLGGGRIESVSATAANGRAIPVTVRDGQVWPRVKLAPGELVSIDAVVRRPGWIAWLSGPTVHAHLTLQTPTASLREHYLTLAPGAPIQLTFGASVRLLAYGQPGRRLHSYALSRPLSQVSLDRRSPAGTFEVAAAARTWEKLVPRLVSWFPAGARASAVVRPAPGSRIMPTTRIQLTFSQPVTAALDSARVVLSPQVRGSWILLGSHVLEFRPSGAGFPLGTTVTLALPNTVRLFGAARATSSSLASWTVPPASPLRADQILAQLGYLPLDWQATGRPVHHTLRAQVDAAIRPPAGRFVWRYGDIPPSLYEQWQPGVADNVLTRGAIMAFENDHGLPDDGILSAAVWSALIHARIASQRTTFGYTYVMVSEAVPEGLQLWHDGRIVFATDVNTGIPAAPTALGTYPVFEHLPSATMSGVNPDGTPYSDPGIPWVSYFNGGDALHGYIRASYGFPQSLGCVEMPYASAGQVYPYTPIGTLVNISA